MKISVIIPAYNEEERIARTLSEYRSYLSRSFSSYELIAVDDGSADGTERVIRAADGVRCVSYAENRGKGYAVRQGVLRADGDYIFYTDADLSYSPENIGAAMRLFEQGADGVVGVRADKRHDYPPLRRLGSAAVEYIAQKMLKTSVRDTQCGFKAFEGRTAKEVFSRSEMCGFGFDLEIISLCESLGKRLAELPVRFSHRSASRISPISDGTAILRDICRLAVRKKRENARRERM